MVSWSLFHRKWDRDLEIKKNNNFVSHSRVFQDLCLKVSWMRGSPHNPRTTPQDSAQAPHEVRTSPPHKPSAQAAHKLPNLTL